MLTLFSDDLYCCTV